ncbi:MAG: type 4a pilus biogenesis protein PilO [Proteobacteria bacterium]|nr:pilus assembly protein PilO [Pseudomonadota bacterium]NOG60407.1 type 4a pilus biogenesis protein PilO [Pseudomonadota bacterium]
MSFIDDLNNLDPNNPGVWPAPVKALVFALVFAGILFAAWKLDVVGQREELAGLEKEEEEQMVVLDTKQKKAANLEALKEQMKEMEQSFGDMVKQLPNQTEVAGLLIDISQTGLASGLEFKLFQPKGETPKEFYAELPISLSVVGNYHQFGEFVSGIAALPRIVTTHDINIKPLSAKDGGDEPVLQMEAIAKTYRALDEGTEEEEEEVTSKKGKKNKKAKKK